MKKNFIISIEGNEEQIELENKQVVLKTQNLKVLGDKIDIRSGIYTAMKNDKSFADLIVDAAKYYKDVENESNKKEENKIKSSL